MLAGWLLQHEERQEWRLGVWHRGHVPGRFPVQTNTTFYPLPIANTPEQIAIG
jgi:hypothetical protein